MIKELIKEYLMVWNLKYIKNWDIKLEYLV
jgi:hypothetical protein